MKKSLFQNLSAGCLILTAGLCCYAPAANAANIVKANNANNLTLGSSWAAGVVPTSADVAVWDSTVTSANTVSLGASTNWAGLKISNPAGLVTIASDGFTFTNNASGIDLSAATANLTINSGFAIGAAQTWNIANGRTLTLGSAATSLNGNTYNLTIFGAGTVQLTGGTGFLPPNAAVLLPTNSTINLGGNSQTLRSLTLVNANPASNYTATVTSGSLTITNSTDVTANQNDVLDLSGLSAFTFAQPDYARTWRILPSTVFNGTTNTVLLAKSGANGGLNTFNANTVQIGGAAGSSANDNHMGTLRLGTTNNLSAAVFQIGGFNGRGSVNFQTGLTAPILTVRGTNGSSSRAVVVKVGETSSGVRVGDGLLDATGGSLDVLTTNLWISHHIAGANNNDTSTLTMPGGTLDALSLILTYKDGTGTPTLTGTINQQGGTANLKDVMMGTNSNTGAVVFKPTYNLSGGTLRAGNIYIGGGTASGSSIRVINWTNGTIQNYDSSTPLNVASGITISAPGAGSRLFAVDSGLTNTLQNTVSQGASTASALVKNGAGGLDLQGTTDNAFLGLNVSNGVVLLNKTSSGSVHAIGNGLTLNGGNAILAGSGGDQIANANILTINSGTFEVNGQTETIGGLAGSGGTLANSVGSTLTVNVASGTTNISASAIASGDLTFGGAGTQIFTGTDSRSSGLTTINNGVLQIGNGGANGSLQGGSVTVNSPGVLAFKRSGTYQGGGIISGNGSVAQNGSGTLILTNDAHTGSTLINAGSLAVPGGAATIAGSIITVASGANFNTTAGSGFYIQANQILNGSGTVTGDYILSTGATNSGNLAVTGNVILADGSVFNPGAAFAAGTITVTGNVTFSSGNPNLIYNLASTTTPGGGTNSLLAVSGTLDLSALGAGALNLYIRGTPASGTYVLATAGSIVGSASAINVIGSTRYTYTPQIVGNQLRLVVVGNSGNLVWLGDVGPNTWDANNSGNLVWSNRTSNVIDFFNTGDLALFNDQSANPIVNLAGALLPASLTVSNSSVNYVFNDGGSGTIDGPIALIKAGSGSLTINNNNTFSGPVNINGGSVSVAAVAANGSAQPLGAGSALSLSGGTLQYTGPAAGAGEFGRSITLGAGGGTIDQESSGGIYLFVTNKITGAGSLTKIGSQQLIIGDGTTGTGSNDYSGITYVSAGNIQIRNAYALGSTSAKTVIYLGATLSADGTSVTNAIPENLDLAGGTLQGAGGNANFAGVITLVSNSVVGGSSAMTISGQITGPGSIDKLGSGTVTILSTNSNFTGGTTNDAGNLQLGNGTANGTLPGDITINAGSLVALPVSGSTIVVPGSIHGPGQLLVNNLGGTLALTGSNDWTGNVNINAGSVSVNNSASLGSGIKTVQMVNGTSGQPSIHLNGTNGSITLSSNITLNCSWVSGVLFNEAGNNIVQSTISLNAGGGDSLFVVNGGTMDLAGTIGAVVANRGFLLGGAGNGTVSGSVVDSLGSAPRELRVQGTGAWTVSGTNTTTAPANVSSGKLLINGEWAGPANALSIGTLGGIGDVLGAVSIASGATFSPGASIGTFTANSDLTFSNGAALFIELNKSLAQSNDFVVVAGALTAGTGTLTVTNLGPALVTGDKFTLFSQPVVNGNLLTVSGGGAGVTWTNNLAVDGSIQVLSVASPVNTNSFAVGAVISGSNLNLSWPPDRIGWKVQVQTNNLTTGLAGNWFTITNSASGTNYTIPIDPANPSVFIRMIYP